MTAGFGSMLCFGVLVNVRYSSEPINVPNCCVGLWLDSCGECALLATFREKIKIRLNTE